MPKPKQELVEVECPCCRAALKVDPALGKVISHKEPDKPKHALFEEDLGSAVNRIKGEAAKREEAFAKSFADHKTSEQLRDRKWEEMLKQAKEKPDDKPPVRDFDFD
jgi:hypothetical protein